MSISVIKALNSVPGLSWHQKACLKAIAEHCYEGKTKHRVKYSTVTRNTGIPARTLGRAVKAGIDAGCLSVMRTGRSNAFHWHLSSAKPADQKRGSDTSTVQVNIKEFLNADSHEIPLRGNRRDGRSFTEKVAKAHAAAKRTGMSTDPSDLLRLVGISNPSPKQVAATRRILSTSNDQRFQRNDTA